MHRAITISVLLLSIYFCPQVIAANQRTKPDEHSQCNLVFGLVEWRPGQYVNEAGKITGAQVELINEITSQLDCTVHYVLSTWRETLEKIEAGEIDFAGNATLVTERLRFARFSTPYHYDVFLFYVKEENIESFSLSSIEALMATGFRLGLTQDFIYGNALNVWINHPQFNKNISYESSSAINMHKLKDGDIDGLLEDPFVISYNQRTKLIEMKLLPLPIKQLGLESRFIFSKKTLSQEFVSQFDAILKDKMKSPEYNKIWFNPRLINE